MCFIYVYTQGHVKLSWAKHDHHQEKFKSWFSVFVSLSDASRAPSRFGVSAAQQLFLRTADTSIGFTVSLTGSTHNVHRGAGAGLLPDTRRCPLPGTSRVLSQDD